MTKNNLNCFCFICSFCLFFNFFFFVINALTKCNENEALNLLLNTTQSLITRNKIESYIYIIMYI